MKPSKKISLSSRIMGTIIICWFVPIILTIGLVGVYMYHTHFQNKLQELVNELDFNNQICIERINSLVTSAKNSSYDGDIEGNYTKYKKGEISSEELIVLSQKYLTETYSHDTAIKEAILWFYEKPLAMKCYAYNMNVGGGYNAVKHYWDDDHSDIFEYAKTLDTAVGFYESDGRIYLVRNLMDRSYNPMGVLVIRMNKEYCFGNFLAPIENASVNIQLKDCLCVLQGSTLPEDQIALGTKKKDGIGYERQNPNLLLYSNAHENSYTMRVFVEYNDTSSLVPNYGYQTIVVFMILLMIPLFYFCIRVIQKYVSAPIRSMVYGAEQIEDGDLGYQLQVDSKSAEFSYLIDTFNHMSERLKRQFVHIYEEEVALREARIMALQAHINPHFLNNTLEIINWEARMNGNEKVSKMIEALSVLLDASLDRKKQPEVALEEEMRHVNAYLYIISERYGDRIHVINEIPEELMECKVPRLILQPIIENSIEHGVGKKRRGTVLLQGSIEGDFLYLDIINDTGEKLNQEKINRLLDLKYDTSKEPSGSLGIANVNQRLHILYGAPCRLQLFEIEDDRICARLTILLGKKHKEIQEITE